MYQLNSLNQSNVLTKQIAFTETNFVTFFMVLVTFEYLPIC
jgi:hypothetical protein